MSEKRYPLDITLACAIGLEGGLKQHKNILPNMPADTISFVHEWNGALRDTIISRKEYKSQLGAMGQAILRMGFAPKTVSRLIDWTAVPYRSYYYAKRFLMAYNFVKPHLYLNMNEPGVYDFGRGLSPLTPLISQHFDNVKVYSRDNDLTNDIFADTMNKMGLPNPSYEWPSNIMDKKNKIYMSLGTYVYLPMTQQVRELKWVSENMQHFFVELEFGKNQADASVVGKIGAEYTGGWTKKKISDTIGTHCVDNKWHVERLWSVECNKKGVISIDRLPSYGQRSLMNSTERFLQR